MAELNNRKRKLSSENTALEYREDVGKKQNTNGSGSGPVLNEVEPNLSTTSRTATKTDDTPLIPKSAMKSFSRFLPRNVAGTIGRKTSLLARRTLRTGRSSLQNLNQGWDTMSTFSSTEDDGNSQRDTTQKRKQTLPKNYTLKLRKLREKFKTNRQLRKDRFRSLQNVSQDRFRKELNQSKVENNKQMKLLEKLLEKHNKHLESL